MVQTSWTVAQRVTAKRKGSVAGRVQILVGRRQEGEGAAGGRAEKSVCHGQPIGA